MSINYQKIGERIAEERKYMRKISQEKMAEDLGMYQADISNLEHARKGSGITDLAKLQSIADYFNLPIENLLFGTSLGAHMIRYYGEKMEVKEYRGQRRIKTEKQRGQLQKLLDADPEKIPCWGFTCGDYTCYIFPKELTEVKGFENGRPVGPTLTKWYFYTFFNDIVIANMVCDFAEVFQLVNLEQARWLQRMIQFDVLDTTDAQRTLNPYLVLAQFAGNAQERKRYEDLMVQRMEALHPVWKVPVIFIESIYVREECRQYGVCRLMLDILRRPGDAIVWVNMEPTAGAELEGEYGNYPSYTQADVGQISLNASIAEKLGFTVDPDTWHRQEQVTDPQGNTHMETILVRKCAYYLPHCIKEILKDDGDLVAVGRAKQKVYQSQHPEEGRIPTAVDLYTKNIKEGQRLIAKKVNTDQGSIFVFAARKPGDDHTWFGASRHNPYCEGLDVELLEKFDYLDDALGKTSYIDEYAAFASYIAGVDASAENKTQNKP